MRAFRSDGRKRHGGVGNALNIRHVLNPIRLIVIMFVKLRMSVEEVMEEFAIIVGEVYKDNFTPAQRTSKLRECMQSLLNKKKFPLDLKLEKQGTSGSCVGYASLFACKQLQPIFHRFVVAALRLNVRNKVRLRTYPVPTNLPSDITVIDAAIATCASQPGFLPLSYGAWYESQEYIGAGLGANNPVHQVIEEATSYFSHQPTAVLLSLGSGHPGILSLGSNNQTGLYRLMQEMMADSEQEAQNIQRQMTLTRYFRFSVEQGMQTIDNRAKGLEWILAQTSGYLSHHDVMNRIDACVAELIHVVKPMASKQPGVFYGWCIADSLLTCMTKHLRGINRFLQTISLH
jgi:hypothetical protein